VGESPSTALRPERTGARGFGNLAREEKILEMNIDSLVDDFAVRSFRDEGDADYIAARLAWRAALITPSLWASQQTIEKYLKCVLLLNRIPAKHVKHDLAAALTAINSSGKLVLNLTPATQEFIEYADAFGRFRYLEASNIAFGGNLVTLDRTVWELRRFCTRSEEPRKLVIRRGETPPKVHLSGGYLEKVIDDAADPAREPLLWRNAFFGVRRRHHVRVEQWFKAVNSPLYLHPEMVDEVLKYVHLPRSIVDGYRSRIKP
jgi:hypothetical protein